MHPEPGGESHRAVQFVAVLAELSDGGIPAECMAMMPLS